MVKILGNSKSCSGIWIQNLLCERNTRPIFIPHFEIYSTSKPLGPHFGVYNMYYNDFVRGRIHLIVLAKAPLVK